MAHPFFLLFIGVLATSTSVIFIRLSQTDAVLLAGYRSLLAGLILLPFFIKALRKHKHDYKGSFFFRSLIPGLFLAVHFAIFNIGARLTPAANSTLIINMLPIITPFLFYAILREFINRAEIYGTILSLAGLVVLGVTDYRIDSRHGAGDIICFVSLIFYAFYLVLGRKNRDIVSIWLYVVPLYLTAGITTILVLFIGNESGLTDVPIFCFYTLYEFLLILALALIPTVIGHTIINYSLKYLRAQSVSIIILSQFIFAGVLGYVFLNEIPNYAFYIASTLIVIGALIVIITARPSHTKMG